MRKIIKIKPKNANWRFDGDIPKKFDNHIKNSIPLYEWTHNLSLEISDFFLVNNSLAYDLGCSTGVFLKKLAERNYEKKINLYGIDEISEMIKISKKNNKNFKNVKFLNDNLNKINFLKSNIIYSFYTIQFIHPSKRQALFNKIYKSLKWGGAFLMFEKVRANDARFQDMMSQIYMDYKIQQGFNEKEIIQKSRSLKGVMEPFSTKGNYDLLKRAGFKDIITVFKYLCFEGILAIK